MPAEAGALELTCGRKARRQPLKQRPTAPAAHRVRLEAYLEGRSVRRQPYSRIGLEHPDHRHTAYRLLSRSP